MFRSLDSWIPDVMSSHPCHEDVSENGPQIREFWRDAKINDYSICW